jgi:lysophospholipase L1-like esterase
MKEKKIAFYIISGLICTLFFFGIIELTSRTISFFTGRGFSLSLHEYQATDRKITDIYKWHPFTGFTLNPNTVIQTSHPNQEARPIIVVDQHSFLSNLKNYDHEKSAEEIRIATIGASTTANLNLSYEENWPGRLGSLLQEAYPQKKISIINAGVPGFHTAQSIGNLALRVMPFNPDIVIIYHAYNDLKTIRAELKYSPDYSHIHDKPYGYHQQPGILKRCLNHSMFYVRLRNAYAKYIRNRNAFHKKISKKKESTNQDQADSAQKQRIEKIPPSAVRTFEQHIRTLVAIAEAGGAKVILSSFATLHDPYLDYDHPAVINSLNNHQKAELSALLHFTPGLELSGIFNGIIKFNDVLRLIAQDKKTGWVNSAADVAHGSEHFVDRVHFSKRGAAKMAQNFYPVVRELLN